MQVRTQKEVRKDVKVSGETLYAVALFEKQIKAQVRASKLEHELIHAVQAIPFEEMNEYVQTTEEMRERLEQ